MNIKTMWGLLIGIAVTVAGVTAASAATSGGIGISATRIIYKEGQPSTVKLTNSSTTSAYLMSVKIAQNSSGEGRSPFIASPAVFRLEPQSENSVRIVGDGRGLPRDRESVFYFSAVGIPSSNPLARGNNDGYVSGNMVFSAGNVIKLFWRPAGLVSSPEEAIKNLQFSHAAGGMRIKNASPYYISLARLSVGNAPVMLDGKKGPLMLAPFADSVWPVSGSGKVTWKAVNDYGGIVEASGVVQ